MEAYVEDMVIMSKAGEEFRSDKKEMMVQLHEIIMKLNPKTCAFYAQKGKFLGHIVSNDGIYVNPDIVKALLELKNLYSAKDIQRLNGKLAKMGRFLAK